MSESLDDVIARALAARGRQPQQRRASGDPDLTLLLGDGTTTPYGAAALAGACAEVRACGVGTRNYELNRQAFKVGQLVARGVVNGVEAVRELRAAGIATGLPEREVNLVLRGSDTGAVKAGAGVPREVELRTHEQPDVGWQAPPWQDQPTEGPTIVATDQPTDPPTEESPEAREQAAREGLLRQELRSQWARREARTLLDTEERARSFRVPPGLASLADDLAVPPAPTLWAVQGLVPAGGNVLLTAQFKAGKTTLVNNLARSFADGLPFLDRYAVHVPDGRRMALFNYEVTASQYTEWLRQARIDDPERLTVLNLRGFHLPLTVPHVAAWVVAWLKAHDVAWWVLDPFARAYGGASENDNAEVTAWTNAVDAIKEQAGVDVLVLPVHTGRAEFEVGAERARGATRLDDWADVRWLLTRDKTGNRFLRASGRDVETEEEQLVFDEGTRALTLAGGDRAWVAKRVLEDALVQVVTSRPGIGLRELREALAGDPAVGASTPRITGAIASAQRYRNLVVVKGANNKSLHYIGGQAAAPAIADEGLGADPDDDLGGTR